MSVQVRGACDQVGLFLWEQVPGPWAAFAATVDRLLAFAEDYPVRHMLGGHIEMTRRPGVDYPIRTIYQPEEPPLETDVAEGHAAGLGTRSAPASVLLPG